MTHDDPTAHDDPGRLDARRAAIRRAARAGRAALGNRDELSRAICARLAALPEYEAARTVAYYVGVGGEVDTREAIRHALAGARRVAVPYCADGRLELARLFRLDELAPGAYGVPEPRAELRLEPARAVAVPELDLVVVPGVAFDRSGARLGSGLGYYDRLLERARPDALLVGLAFECQIVPDIPAYPHDVPMDRVVTELAVYRGGRAS